MHDELLERRHALAHRCLPADEPHVAVGQQHFELRASVDDDERADPRFCIVRDASARLADATRWYGSGMTPCCVRLTISHFAHLRSDVSAAKATIDDAEPPPHLHDAIADRVIVSMFADTIGSSA